MSNKGIWLFLLLCLTQMSMDAVASSRDICRLTSPSGNDMNAFNASILCVHLVVEEGQLVVDLDQSWLKFSPYFIEQTSLRKELRDGQQVLSDDAQACLKTRLLTKVSTVIKERSEDWFKILAIGLGGPDEKVPESVKTQSGSWTKFESFLVESGYNPVDLGLDYLEFVKDKIGNALPMASPLFFPQDREIPLSEDEMAEGFVPYLLADPIDLAALEYQFPSVPESKREAETARVKVALRGLEGDLWDRPHIREQLIIHYRSLDIRLSSNDILLPGPDAPNKFVKINFNHLSRIILPFKDTNDITIDKILYLMLPDRVFHVLPLPSDPKRKDYLKPLATTGASEPNALAVSYKDLAPEPPILNQSKLQIQQFQLAQLGYVVQVGHPQNGLVDLFVREAVEGTTDGEHFKITEQVLDRLEAEDVPDEVLDKLKTIKDRETKGEKQFLSLLETTIGKDFSAQYKSLILKQAAKGTFPLPARRPQGEQGGLDPSRSDLPLDISSDASKEKPQPSQKRKNYLGAGLSYRPDQGMRFYGLYQREDLLGGQLGIKVGTDQDRPLLTGEYFRDFAGFRLFGRRRFSIRLGGFSDVETNRVLRGDNTDEERVGGGGRFELEAFRDLNGNQLRVYFGGQYVDVSLEETTQTQEEKDLSYVEIGSLYQFRGQGPNRSRLRLEPQLRLGVRTVSDILSYTLFKLKVNLHQRLTNHIALDISVTAGWADEDTPLVEQLSIGGAESLRGFRRDAAIGREMVSLQPEFWAPIPGVGGDASGFRAFLREHLRLVVFADVGWISKTDGSSGGWRTGPGLGLRFLYNFVIFKLDWAYGLRNTDIQTGRGRVYFSVGTDLPF